MSFFSYLNDVPKGSGGHLTQRQIGRDFRFQYKYRKLGVMGPLWTLHPQVSENEIRLHLLWSALSPSFLTNKWSFSKQYKKELKIKVPCMRSDDRPAH